MDYFSHISKSICKECQIEPVVLMENKDEIGYNVFFQLKNSFGTQIQSVFGLNFHNSIGSISENSNPVHVKEFDTVDDAIKYSYSYAVSKFSHGDLKYLSCRNDMHLLEERERLSDPTKRLRNNSFIKCLLEKPYYKNLINFTANKRGVFLKKREIPPEKNYFNTSLNGGLPIVKKADEFHEGTFMLHDIYHFLFMDPILSGNESEGEKALYIASRMLGEAMSLVFADILAIQHSGIQGSGYDTKKRKIFPLVENHKHLLSELSFIKKIAYANSVYCLYGDLSLLQEIASEDAIGEYDSKYKKFFSGDFRRNENNVKSFFQENHKIEHVPDGYIRTSELAKKISINNSSTFSFNALFEIFWSQFEEMLLYNQDFNPIENQKISTIKYLCGQVPIFHKYSTELSANFDLDQLNKTVSNSMSQIKNLEDSDKIHQEFQNINSTIHTIINYLEEKNIILPHQGKIYKMHFTHFKPLYVGYDHHETKYETLSSIGDRLLGKYIIRGETYIESVSMQKQAHYLKLINK